jgi:AAA domain
MYTGGSQGRVGKESKTKKIRRILREVEVLATTLNSAGGDIANKLAPKGKKWQKERLKFDLLIVDEASQATEPSLLIPLSLLKRNVCLQDQVIRALCASFRCMLLRCCCHCVLRNSSTDLC